MKVYDCDDDEQFAALEARMEADALVDNRLIQTFGPDTLAEARNRSFKPA